MKVEITQGWDGDAVASLGDAADAADAASAVAKWCERSSFVVPASVWTVTKMVDKGYRVVDFGSHVYFARYVEEPK